VVVRVALCLLYHPVLYWSGARRWGWWGCHDDRSRLSPGPFTDHWFFRKTEVVVLEPVLCVEVNGLWKTGESIAVELTVVRGADIDIVV
jgi:hypothetical protein